MTDTNHPEREFEHDDFDPALVEDDIRIDEQCRELLKRFYQSLVAAGMTPQRASERAFAADLYVRDYLLDFARQNLARPQPGVIRRFAATWFITHTLDPEMKVLERHLDGIIEFYRYLQQQHLISPEELHFLEDEAAQREYYRQRIERFLDIVGDGYYAWEAECPLKDRYNFGAVPNDSSDT
jgi:hypothetical protein